MSRARRLSCAASAWSRRGLHPGAAFIPERPSSRSALHPGAAFILARPAGAALRSEPEREQCKQRPHILRLHRGPILHRGGTSATGAGAVRPPCPPPCTCRCVRPIGSTLATNQHPSATRSSGGTPRIKLVEQGPDSSRNDGGVEQEIDPKPFPEALVQFPTRLVRAVFFETLFFGRIVLPGRIVFWRHG